MFLPQRPYLPPGPLRRAVCYPLDEAGLTDAEIAGVLEHTGLGHLSDQLAVVDGWERRLSGGEQQRLAFARVLLNKPDWLFLDEATCSLDEAAEAHLYALLTRFLPGLTLVSVAHGRGVARFHSRFLHLGDGTVLVARSPVER